MMVVEFDRHGIQPSLWVDCIKPTCKKVTTRWKKERAMLNKKKVANLDVVRLSLSLSPSSMLRVFASYQTDTLRRIIECLSSFFSEQTSPKPRKQWINQANQQTRTLTDTGTLDVRRMSEWGWCRPVKSETNAVSRSTPAPFSIPAEPMIPRATLFFALWRFF